MWFPAAKCPVAVIVADVFDPLEIWFQDIDISVDKWAVIFFLTEIESCVIWCPHFWWSFHGGCPFLFLFGGWDVRAVGEIDFAAENGKMGAINRGHIPWMRNGYCLLMLFVSATCFNFYLKCWRGVCWCWFWIKWRGRNAHRNYLRHQSSAKRAGHNM